MSEGSREVEVAVGYADHTWEELWVTVTEDPNYVLDDCEIRDKASKVVMEGAINQKRNVSFIHIIFLNPDDTLDGIL